MASVWSIIVRLMCVCVSIDLIVKEKQIGSDASRIVYNNK